MLTVFFTLSEKQQTWIKAALIVLLIVILVLAIFGFIGMLIEKTMKWQGSKVDAYMSNLVLSKKINKPEDFNRIALKKSKIVFFNASIVPIVFEIIAALIFVIYHITTNGGWSESIFDYKTGILTLFYVPDWKSIVITLSTDTGLAFDVQWVNTPHFVEGAQICNYFIFLFMAVGLIWYLVNVQAYCARLVRIIKLRRTIYSKDLSKIDLTHFYNMDRVNPKAKEKASTSTSLTNPEQK